MSEFFDKPSGGPGRGIWPTEVKRKCVNRSGTAYEKGDCVVLDLAASVAELTTSSATTYNQGDDSVFDTIINPVAADATDGAIFGIVVEDGGIANDATGEVQFFGIVEEAYVIHTGGSTIIPGQRLVSGGAAGGAQAMDLDATLAAGEHYIARYLAPSDTASTHKLKKVFFNGFAMNVVNHS